MLTFFKNISLLATLATQAIEPDTVHLPAPSQEKRFVFGSLSIAPGGGLSMRERKGQSGTAIDIKGGIAFIPFDTLQPFPIVTYDYNWFYYFSKEPDRLSPYLSGGLGALYIIPYIPLRAGVESQHLFFDIGAKFLMGYLPVPEARAGLQMDF